MSGVYEEGSAEWHRIMAPYLDNIAKFEAEVQRTNDEIAAEQAAYAEVLADREAKAAEELARIEAQRAELQAAEEAKANPWGRKPAYDSATFSLGATQEEWPETPHPAPKRSPRHARPEPAEDDDEDFSNRSWMQ